MKKIIATDLKNMTNKNTQELDEHPSFERQREASWFDGMGYWKLLE